MHQYKVTVLGSRKTGKTALVHFMTNSSKHGGQYLPTKETDMRHLKLTHPNHDIKDCSVAIEDTAGFKALDQKGDAPDLLEPKIAYMWCDDGVRKPGAEDPNAEVEGDDSVVAEKTPLVANELKAVSPIDSKLDRQGFIVVYNPMDKDSFTAARNLLTDLQEKMAKPEEEIKEGEEGEKKPSVDEEEEVEIPAHPFVVVATHEDLKRKQKVKNAVTAEEGEEMAMSVAAQFFEVNARGKNAKKALEAVIEAIHKVEMNIVYDKEPSWWEKNCGCINRCYTNVCCCGCMAGCSCCSSCSIM